MEFTKRTLGDICDEVKGIIQTGPFGSQLHKSDYKSEGIPVVMPKNIIEDKISIEEIARIGKEDVERLSQYTLQKGDIVYGRRGDIGRRALIKHEQTGWLCGTGCIKISLKSVSILDPSFLYYYLGQTEIVSWIYNQAIGATMPNLNTSIIRSIPITYPYLNEQKKIASILYNYDDLIENNTRRIEILEEMAKLIYEEWFVKFRFPGHENIKMISSDLGEIPEGWKIIRVGDLLRSLESGSRPKGGVGDLENGVPSIGAENIIGLGIYDFSKEKYVSFEFFNKMKKGIVKHKDVLLYKDGAQIGRKTMFRDSFPHKKCCINEHVFILRAKDQSYQNYLYFWLDLNLMTENIKNLNSNAAQPGINQEDVKSLPILVPPAEIVLKIDRILEQILNQIFVLAKKNRNLRKTRDLLLPKLISGEIDVSDLNISIRNEFQEL